MIVRRCPTNRWTGAARSAFRIKADRAKLVRFARPGQRDRCALAMAFGDQLMTAINDDHVETVRCLISESGDLNVRCDQGASVIYGAILKGNISIVRLLLENGADPNFMACEPAATIYADQPLDLAKHCRFLLDWERYDPIVDLLKQFGATETNRAEITDAEIERRARKWQAHPAQ